MEAEPRATYRLQLRPGFGFDQVAALAPYLAELGISHVYLSPCLQAARGSVHGYDVVDHHRVNEELGGWAAHDRMCAALRSNGLAQLLDIVPNHMAVRGPENPWWWDVLENGPSSNYASYFDVDWDPPETRLRNTVLLPVLGDQYGKVLEAGEIKLAREGASFVIRYFDNKFPAAPRALDTVLAAAAARSGSSDLAFAADALGNLPLSTLTDHESVRRRHRDKSVLGRQIARLIEEDPRIAPAIDSAIEEINRNPDALHAFLERQNFRLAYWRAAARDFGYRRFFDINTMVGLRMEDERVFSETHGLVLRWLSDGTVSGLRIDHIDGLREPGKYLARLRAAAPEAWIIVEKILERGEKLRETWPVAGTTGYDFLNAVNGLLIDPAGEEPLTSFYSEFTGESDDFETIALEKKTLVLREILGADLNRLTAMFLEICERHRRYRDFTRHELHEALRAVIIRFPVYRTYFSASNGNGGPHHDDFRYLREAVASARHDSPEIDPLIFGFLGDLLSLQVPGPLETELALRFQQLTGPVMAKAVEDTSFYCFNRFAGLNDVGGDPGHFGVSIAEFLDACEHTRQSWPRTMLATSTHDTKRSEDVRARLATLSEIPQQWIEAVRRWSAMNEPHWSRHKPDRNAEYLFYQTAVGAWPLEAERAAAYMEKAAREAKRNTSWNKPNRRYENALRRFVEGTLRDREFVADLVSFVDSIRDAGRIKSLSQTLIKLTAPGVPDLYQGSELWDLSLVDPDNRRPVDYEMRKLLLEELERLSPEQMMERNDEGLPKMWTIRRALALRRRAPQHFGSDAAFQPLRVSGPRAEHLVAFARGTGVITIAPRLVIKGGGSWHDTITEFPPGRWLNELTGETVTGGEVKIAALLARFPVGLLSRQDGA